MSRKYKSRNSHFVNVQQFIGEYTSQTNRRSMRQRGYRIEQDSNLLYRLNRKPGMNLRLLSRLHAEPYSPHEDWVNFKRCIRCGQVNEVGFNSTGKGHGLTFTQVSDYVSTHENQLGVGCGLCGSKNWLGL